MKDMIISVGGAYVRVWRPGRGLAVELPAAAVVDKEGQIIALGEEAAGREGKLSDEMAFWRPFWADRITHRYLLREILRLALEQSQASGDWWERWRVTLLLPPNIPPLHATWLEKTLREVGVGWIEHFDPLATLVKSQVGRSKTVPIMGVVDWGFSQLRVVIYSGETVLCLASAPHLSLSEFCRQLIAAERKDSRRSFPLASLYSQQWGVTHVAYDERSARPVVGTLNNKILTQTRQAFAEEALKLMAKLVRDLNPEQAAFFRQQGWLVVGGGAELVGSVETWAETLGVPVRVAANAPYATLQGAKK